MTPSQRTYDPGVANSAARLPLPPEHWSYSALKEIESCPRRYVLGHASYPELWTGSGYPQQPSPSALFGDVVHDSLERIINALVAAGCSSANSIEAVAVLRGLGGYSAVAAEALGARLFKLDGNPRLDVDGRLRLQQYLENRIPEARTEIQGYLQRMELVPRPPAASGVPSSPGRHAITIGSHPEVALCADRLRVKGRVDLLTLSAVNADIVDHKTGAQDPSHLDQVRFYAMLWDQDDIANGARTPLGSLTASYPSEDVRIEPPDADGLAQLVADTAERVADADAWVVATEPVARPGEQCMYCAVRSLCDVYWQQETPDLASLRDGKWFDYEGRVGPRNGVKSWWMLDDSGQKELLVRTPPTRPLTSGQLLRIIGLRREDDPDVDRPVATLTTNSEIFVVAGNSS